MNGTLADGRNLEIFKKFKDLNWNQFWVAGVEVVESNWVWEDDRPAVNINLQIRRASYCAALMNENSKPLLVAEQCRHDRYGALCGKSNDGTCEPDSNKGFEVLSKKPCIRYKNVQKSWFDARDACSEINSNLLNFVYNVIKFFF